MVGVPQRGLAVMPHMRGQSLDLECGRWWCLFTNDAPEEADSQLRGGFMLVLPQTSRRRIQDWGHRSCPHTDCRPVRRESGPLASPRWRDALRCDPWGYAGHIKTLSNRNTVNCQTLGLCCWHRARIEMRSTNWEGQKLTEVSEYLQYLHPFSEVTWLSC